MISARQYINGRWEAGVTTGQTRNPAMADEVVCEYARADRSQTLKALHAARDAAPLWAQALPQRRADALGAVARELQQRRQTLATLLAGETGRPLSEALSEVRQAAQRFQLLSARAARGATAQVLNGEGCWRRPESEPMGIFDSEGKGGKMGCSSVYLASGRAVPADVAYHPMLRTPPGCAGTASHTLRLRKVPATHTAINPLNARRPQLLSVGIPKRSDGGAGTGTMGSLMMPLTVKSLSPSPPSVTV